MISPQILDRSEVENRTVLKPGPFRTDWAGRSTSRTPVTIDVYRESVGKRMDASLDGSGKQKGDPVRGCEAIIEAVEQNSPHLRLLLGDMAYKLATEKLEGMSANFNDWKALSLGADFPENEQ